MLSLSDSINEFRTKNDGLQKWQIPSILSWRSQWMAAKV